MNGRLRFLLALALVVPLTATPRSSHAADPVQGAKIDLKRIEKAAREEFARFPDYRPGYIITRDQVEYVFERLAKLGWNVPDRAAILEKVPAQDEFLVRKLRTPKGRIFMNDVDRYPLAYDKLDRLSRMPQGHTTIEWLIRGPDGYKLIQYMATSEGGRNFGKQLSNTPKGRDFNKPTGRIYTERQLLGLLFKKP